MISFHWLMWRVSVGMLLRSLCGFAVHSEVSVLLNDCSSVVSGVDPTRTGHSMMSSGSWQGWQGWSASSNKSKKMDAVESLSERKDALA